jgi:hypothetical protein
MVSRYYYSEEGEKLAEVPDCLKSHKFHRVPESVPSVLSVPKSPGDNGHGTVGTLGTDYFTRSKNNNKPDYPCPDCGSNNWCRMDGAWICGCCHPETREEFMFSLEKEGTG